MRKVDQPKLDQMAVQKQLDLKHSVEALELQLKKLIPTFQVDAANLKLKEFYMWASKAIAEDQSERDTIMRTNHD